MARKRLGEILIELQIIDETKLRRALAEQQRWGGPLGKILIDMNFVEESALVQALSKQLAVPSVDLSKKRIPSHVLDLIPVAFCNQHGVIGFAQEGKFLDLAMSDPTQLNVIDELRIKTRLNVRPYIAGPKSIEQTIHQAYFGEDGGSLAASGGVEISMTNSIVGMKEGRRRGDADTQEAKPMSVRDMRMSNVLTDMSRRRKVVSSDGARDSSGDDHARPQLEPEARRGAREGSAPAISPSSGAAERISALEQRIQELEAVRARDEDVIRKLMALLIEKGVCTREELRQRMQK